MPSISTKGNKIPPSPIRKLVPYADDAKKIFDDAVKKGIESVLLQVFQNDFSRFLILKIK